MHANEEIDKATENRLLGIESIAYLSSQNKLGRTIPTGCKIMNEFLRSNKLIIL